MRLIFLLTQSLESPSGFGRFLPLARALAERGYQITLIALHHDFANVTSRRFQQDGVEVWYVGQMHVRKVGNQKLYFSPLKLLWVTAWSTLRLTWAAYRTPADAIHVCKAQPMNGVAAWLVSQLKGIPVYLDTDDYEAANNQFNGRWQQRLVAKFEDWYATFAAGITANTTFLINHYRTLGYPADQIRHVPNGVDPAWFAPLSQPDAAQTVAHLRERLSLTPEQPCLVYVGTLSFVSHAVDLLLTAFAAVHSQHPQARLLLVGGGKDMATLQAWVQERGLETAVYFTGRVPLADIPYYYRLGWFTIDPRRRTLSAESCLSLKLVESIVAGVPCITTDIGDRRALVGDAGWAIPPDDVDALQAAIDRLLREPDTRQAMADAAWGMREHFFWTTPSRLDAFTALYPHSG